MTPNEYATKLRHAADVIERTGAEVRYQICSDHYAISFPSFLRIFAGQMVTQRQMGGETQVESSVDGIHFYAYLEKPNADEPDTITLPPL